MTSPARPPLRVALFSGNYNYVRDGANQALNRLVAYLLRQGVAVRVYSPTTDTPAFEPAGDLVSVPSFPIPFGRGEYRTAIGLPGSIRRDLEHFAPDVAHISAPEILGHRAISWARRRRIPVLASMHTRFETYFDYYGMGWIVPAVLAGMRRFYGRCDAVVAPSQSMADYMLAERMHDRISIWARGIDAGVFHPGQRDMSWRTSLGLHDDEVVIGFLGRLVMEKGLDIFAASIEQLKALGVAHRVLVIGDGPARDWFRSALPDAVFAGHQAGADLGRAVASMDIFFNPSTTETFGNVTVEAMASGLPVVAANATGSRDIVKDGITGRLVTSGDAHGFADALSAYCTDTKLRHAHGDAGLSESRLYDWDAVNSVVLAEYQRLASSVVR